MRSIIREIIITVLLAVVFFVGIRSVVHNFEVNGFSMEPGLRDGQFIIVSKAAYWFGSPQRGDVVVFDTPRMRHGIIHRIVGLPGERVEFKAGDPYVYIDGTRLDEPYVQGESTASFSDVVPGGSYFIIGDNRGAASWDIVPKGDIIGKAWVCYWPISEWGLAPNHSW